MKFNVGDVVRVKSLEWYEENKDQYGEVGNFVEDMSDFCGTEQEITSLYGYAGYFFKDGSGWVWDDSMLEGAEEEVKPEFDNVVDMVNSPPHYNAGAVECIVAIEASMTKEAFEGYLKGNVTKYLWRYEKKEKPLEDVKKARYYLNRLIQVLEEAK